MKTILPNGWYDVLKWVSCIGLHAVAFLVSRFGEIWGIPYAEQIVETINAVGTFIGMLIGVSCYQYAKNGADGGNE